MHFTIGTLRITFTCWWGNVFLQLVIFLIGQSEVCGRRISIETKRNDEISNNLGFNTSSRESSIKATALTNAISDNLEIDGMSSHTVTYILLTAVTVLFQT